MGSAPSNSDRCTGSDANADNVVASRYRVERALAEAGPFAVVGEVKPSRGSFRDDQGLKDAAVYYYRVVAVGETGLASKPSPVVETMTAPPPDPPAEVKAHAPSSRCVAVSWTPPRAEGVVKYRVERAEAGEAPKWALRSETDKTTFTDGGRAGCDVADSTKYLYRVTAVNRVERRKKNRGKKPARPAGAPEPQDHLPKRDPRAAEAANGSTYVLTLWDETVEIDQADLIDSWDFQLGTVQNNPLMMVKGLLGDKFAWFTVRARADGKTPLEAANEVMQMFARATGFDSTGK